MIRYEHGNYYTRAHARKPEGIEDKQAWIVGSGLAGLAAGIALVRDAQMPGKNIHIFEKCATAGGALDAMEFPQLGYTMRGDREMEDHFEVMWDLLGTVPSIETPDCTVLDEYFWLDQDDPNVNYCRLTHKKGEAYNPEGKYSLSDHVAKQLMDLYFTPEEKLQDVRINEFFDQETLDSNFWLYWRTTFAFENWHSALEMKRYMNRFIHHFDGLADLSALKFTKYNQYESMIRPMEEYLKSQGVQFHYSTKVDDIRFDVSKNEKTVQSLTVTHDGKTETMDMSPEDYVFITIGGMVENTAFGSQTTVPEFNTDLSDDGGWSLWRKIASQSHDFGNPDKFCTTPEQTSYESAMVETFDDRLFPYLSKIVKRDIMTGKNVSGGIVTVQDSNWLMSWTINRQPQFKNQRDDQCVIYVNGMFIDKPGNYIKKPMKDCTGEEICMEWLYHIGVPEDQIEDIAKNHTNTVPCIMPFVTAFFMPRTGTDRPLVRPEGAKNFAFIGEFAETARDTIFTTEYAMRTGMEAVYDLFDVERFVPEVFGSTYDIRSLLKAAVTILDGKPLTSIEMNPVEKMAVAGLLKKIEGTDIEKILKEYKAI